MRIGDVVSMHSCATVQGLGIPEVAPPDSTMTFIFLGMETPDMEVDVGKFLRGEYPIHRSRLGKWKGEE